MHHDKRTALAQERDTVRRNQDSVAGERRNAVLTQLDGEIKALCTHDSINWDSRASSDGRIITTCERCGISWHEHVG